MPFREYMGVGWAGQLDLALSLSLSLSQTNMWTKMCLIWPEAQINNMKTHNNNIFFVFYNVQINPFRNSKPIQHFYFVKVQTIIFSTENIIASLIICNVLLIWKYHFWKCNFPLWPGLSVCSSVGRCVDLLLCQLKFPIRAGSYTSMLLLDHFCMGKRGEGGGAR